MSTNLKLIKQGAEARLYLSEYNGKPCIIKERFIKKYRHPELDVQITKERIKAESKTINRCNSIGVLTPKIYGMDLNERKLYIEYIANSLTAKEYIKSLSVSTLLMNDKLLLKTLCNKIGSAIGKMHLNNIIHGDLTTSNMLIAKKPNTSDEYDVIMIDFGLSHYSQNQEDKGVDLYVLERALLSTHSDLPELFTMILNSYKENNNRFAEVISKFEEVRNRGRKRTMIG